MSLYPTLVIYKKFLTGNSLDGFPHCMIGREMCYTLFMDKKMKNHNVKVGKKSMTKKTVRSASSRKSRGFISPIHSSSCSFCLLSVEVDGGGFMEVIVKYPPQKFIVIEVE